jgi:hypothetical protein
LICSNNGEVEKSAKDAILKTIRIVDNGVSTAATTVLLWPDNFSVCCCNTTTLAPASH